LRKISAILLLAILLFYTAGYRWMFSIMENKAAAKLERHINSGNYKSEELVEIRIPLNMPYYSDKEFESVYGETDWNGRHYQYVKRKIESNTLILLCLPNIEKNNIASAENNLTKNLSDISSSTSGHQKQTPVTVKIKLSDFDSYAMVFSLNQFTTAKQTYSIANDGMNTLFTPLTPAQPPEVIC
jgi:hypothetical protein